MTTCTHYTDEFLNIHEKAKELGKGGQGIVYRTKDPNLAIKMVIDAQGEAICSPEQVRQYAEKLLRVRLMPLSSDIHISTPVALLKQYAGYVMHLLAEMVPFDSFWLNKDISAQMSRAEMPVWLVGDKNQVMDEKQLEDRKKIWHYAKTGGLRRRLKALHGCADIVAQLHGRGLVYGDISHNNVFISEDLQHTEVWLIDADNLAFDQESAFGVYTPKYGAPELVQCQDGGRPATDCHAFAVMAFYLLSTVHPFIGKKVLGGIDDDGDWADSSANANEGGDLDEQAYAGRFPWIYDQHDESNKAIGGLPPALILTSHLSALFQKNFSEGRNNPAQRPVIYHWVNALAQAIDQTIECTQCRMSWYADIASLQCPYCQGKKPTILCLKAYIWQDGLIADQPCWTFMHELYIDTPVHIPKRVMQDVSSNIAGQYELQIMRENEKYLHFKKSEFAEYDLSVAIPDIDQGTFHKMLHQVRVEISKNQPVVFWLYVHGEYPRVIQGSIIGAES
ncbi:MAG: lipopolysaccharide kinase [Gammaproteobacteria bacterium]|jgi:serine/threonine protein kinase|nr:lipopolysaccharide kinase [Gammaproteobacteria bacterium]